MSDDSIRPVPNDPTSDQIQKMLDLATGDWWYTDAGDYDAAAVELFKKDGSNYQLAIALTWPCRIRGTNELRTLQLLLSPEHALNLASHLTHVARWLKAREIIGN